MRRKDSLCVPRWQYSCLDGGRPAFKNAFFEKKEIEWRWRNSKKYMMDHLVDLILDLFLLPDQAHLQVF
jgi:hypothetical protein